MKVSGRGSPAVTSGCWQLEPALVTLCVIWQGGEGGSEDSFVSPGSMAGMEHVARE